MERLNSGAGDWGERGQPGGCGRITRPSAGDDSVKNVISSEKTNLQQNSRQVGPLLFRTMEMSVFAIPWVLTSEWPVGGVGPLPTPDTQVHHFLSLSLRTTTSP